MSNKDECRGRCDKCKKQVNILNAEEVRMKNGMRALKGDCEKCGGTVFRIQGKS